MPHNNLPLRVLLVGPNPWPLGGQAVQLHRLLARLRTNRSIEVSFLAINPHFVRGFAWLQEVKFLRTIANMLVYYCGLLWAVPRTDVVHIFSSAYWSFFIASSPAILVARVFRKRIVLNYRSGEGPNHLRQWRRFAPKAMRLAHAIVVPSDYLVGVFAQYDLHARAIRNFVELEKIPYRERRTFKPIFLANRLLWPLYNVGCAIRAFQQVQKEYPDARLIVAGDGSERPNLERLVAELALRNVQFRGELTQEEMWAAYSEADIYLNSPNIDNMPGSILEAFAAGTPVISTAAGGIPLIVADGESGLLSPVGNSAALAANALRILRNPEIGVALTLRARQEVISKYTWEAVQDQWLAVYRPES